MEKPTKEQLCLAGKFYKETISNNGKHPFIVVNGDGKVVYEAATTVCLASLWLQRSPTPLENAYLFLTPRPAKNEIGLSEEEAWEQTRSYVAAMSRHPYCSNVVVTNSVKKCIAIRLTDEYPSKILAVATMIRFMWDGHNSPQIDTLFHLKTCYPKLTWVQLMTLVSIWRWSKDRLNYYLEGNSGAHTPFGEYPSITNLGRFLTKSPRMEEIWDTNERKIKTGDHSIARFKIGVRDNWIRNGKECIPTLIEHLQPDISEDGWRGWHCKEKVFGEKIIGKTLSLMKGAA